MRTPERFYFNPSGRGLEVFLGPTEARLMELAWVHETLTVKRALFLLGDDERAYTTIMTVLNRLAGKKFLARRKEGKGFVYSAAVNREEFLRERIRTIDEALRVNFAEYL